MSNIQMWSLIVGFFLPLAIAFLQRPNFSSPVRAGITFVVSAIAGAGTAYFQGDLTGRRFVESALVILVATIATYKGLWQPTVVAPAIERKTSPKSSL